MIRLNFIHEALSHLMLIVMLHLADYLFQNEPSCTATTTCTCGVTESRRTITLNVNVDILLQEGLHHMQHDINDVTNVKRSSICPTCDT